ncbi:MAG TPA: hypothetical protein VMZ28_15625 [Kofleriaceae bacterium]|nr:hypothetical protein [Kofleriaceae bacterium]
MVARGAALAVTIGVMSACGFSASFDGTRFRCDVSSECPRGMECEGGFCGGEAAEEDGGGGGAGDGGEADADTRSIVERACPGEILDSDTFDFFAGSRWFIFDDGGDGTIDTAGGVMHGDVDVASGRVGMVSAESWALADVAVAFRIPEGAPLDATYFAFELITVVDEVALLTIFRDEDVVVAELTDPPGGGVNVGEALYVPAEQEVWRIRVQDEAVVYEMSPDGLAWTELAAESNAGLPDQFRIRMVLETSAGADDYVQDLDDMVVCGGL